jgi:D-beta-D-heptose 7-phosphate kinase/D-beta-D-heptose 1-phosphate adenosyltransferase
LKIVMANGCFDPFHYGHLVYLEEARKQGDLLVVAVTTDDGIRKGPGRPVFSLEERMAVLRALTLVDVVVASRTGLEAVQMVKPDVYVKGSEYEGKLPEQKAVEAYGGRVYFTKGPVYSSTKLLNGGYLRVQSPGSR